jgi:hypothetical protein
VIVSEDMTEYVHAHPREETQPDPNAGPTGGPEIIFDALLPKPGRYRAWLQFQRNDRLSTVSFTFAAPRQGKTAHFVRGRTTSWSDGLRRWDRLAIARR